jgi:hypothetical protein
VAIIASTFSTGVPGCTLWQEQRMKPSRQSIDRLSLQNGPHALFWSHGFAIRRSEWGPATTICQCNKPTGRLKCAKPADRLGGWYGAADGAQPRGPWERGSRRGILPGRVEAAGCRFRLPHQH